jgi:hypothetical protein
MAVSLPAEAVSTSNFAKGQKARRRPSLSWEFPSKKFPV